MTAVKISTWSFIACLTMLCTGTAEAASGNGVVTVTSEPSGANFSLYSYSGGHQYGTTPATFNNLPSGSYSVSFSPVKDCRIAKSQTRSLDENGRIDFHGDYLCKDEIPVSNTTPTPAATLPPRANVINVRLWNSFHQAETLPGNSSLVTIGVRNISKSTIHNLQLSQSFNPNQVEISTVLPRGGTQYAKQILWNIPVIYAGQSWTTTFPVTMKDALQTGDTVQLIAHVSGDDIKSPRGELLSEIASIGIATLPATGSKEWAAVFAVLVALLAIITSFLSSRRKKAVVLTV